jgi:hypothetical protein
MTLGFSTFRELLDIWDIQIENQRADQVRSLLKSDSLIFFFEKDKEFFGAPEGSRVVFAKLKTPDEDVTPSWDTEASFMAINLSKMLEDGNPSKRIFYKKDMKNMEIVERKEVEKKLLGNKDVSKFK